MAKRYRVTLTPEERAELVAMISEGEAGPAPRRLRPMLGSLLQADGAPGGPGAPMPPSLRPWIPVPAPSSGSASGSSSRASISPPRQADQVFGPLPASGERPGGPPDRPGLLDAAEGQEAVGPAAARRRDGGAGARRVAVARGRAPGAGKNEIKPHLRRMWCIPPKASAEFVCHMEDVLDVYHRPYDPRRPVVDCEPNRASGSSAGPASRCRRPFDYPQLAARVPCRGPGLLQVGPSRRAATAHHCFPLGSHPTWTPGVSHQLDQGDFPDRRLKARLGKILGDLGPEDPASPWSRWPAGTGPPPRPPTASSTAPGSTRASSWPGTSPTPQPGPVRRDHGPDPGPARHHRVQLPRARCGPGGDRPTLAPQGPARHRHTVVPECSCTPAWC